jgi:hypothetical protein
MGRDQRLKACPTCGRAFPPIIEVGGKRRQTMFDYVARHPEGVTVWQILETVWADDPNGGPELHNIVSVMAKQINTKLAELGASCRIRASGGPGSLYRLQECDVDQTN